MNVLAILLFLAFQAPLPAFAAPRMPSAVADTCPASKPAQLARLQSFFSAEQTYHFRAAHGLLGIGPADVRALTDAQDATTCTRMAASLRVEQTESYPKVWRGYQAGNFFVMVVSTEVPPGVLYYGSGGMVVLDANMEIVALADF